MPAKVISIHSENNIFQHLEVIKRNREKRNRSGEFLVEGTIAINQAVEKKWPLNAFIYAKGKKLSDWAKQILTSCKVNFHYELSPKLMEKISDKEDTSEILAVAQIPADDLSNIRLQDSFLVMVCDRPSSPGNLGTTVRSCDALGAAGIIVTGHATDPYHPLAMRSSMGSLFSVPIVRVPSHNEVLAWVKTVRTEHPDLCIVGTSAKALQKLWEHDFKRPTILVMGNETWGLSKAWKEACDSLVTIPMCGSASSLNVSCAAAVMLYEISRQRLTK